MTKRRAKARLKFSRYYRVEAPGALRPFINCATVRNRQHTGRVPRKWSRYAKNRLNKICYDNLFNWLTRLLACVIKCTGVKPIAPLNEKI